MREMINIEGRVWLIGDEDGKLIPDIDTDQIFHNKHLAITNIDEMGQYAFGNLESWKDFPQKARAGDIIVVGENFGAGSSRQQAVDCFRSLGISLIIGVSFGAIYWRNAVNSGMPILKAPWLAQLRPPSGTPQIKTGDNIKVNLMTGEMINVSDGYALPPALPMSEVQREIYLAGSLFEYARRAM